MKMLPTMRQHAITWIGRTRVGKSVRSKTILFAQSRFEIDQANRADLVPSIVTAKHLDFFKAEPITKFKPGVFDDGLLQRMDASFLKTFLNPSVTWSEASVSMDITDNNTKHSSRMKRPVTFACDHCAGKCQTKEEDATVWARYSSAQFDQGAGRHACNNPYNQNVDRELFEQMQKEHKTCPIQES